MRITKHAYKRAKERCGINKKSLDRVLQIALTKGLKHTDATGNLRKYIDHEYRKYKIANNMRVHGEFLFICSQNVLITVVRLPHNLLKYVRKKPD